MLKNVVLLLIAAFGAILFMFAPGEYWWLVGASIFVVAWLFLLLVIIPFTKVSRRGLLAFLASGAIVTGLAAMEFMQAAPTQPVDGGTAVSLASIGVRLLAAINGIFISIMVIPIFFIVVGYFSSIYVVALHEEDLSFGKAFLSYIYLILGVNLAWLVVEDGKIIEIKKQGFANGWLSRGKIVIKPGNAIVTERGSKITGIHGPGVKLTKKNERIRTVFDLRPQFVSQLVENVITADRIPLDVEMGIGYQITPASNPDAPSVLKEKNFGVFPVERDTLHKAAFNGTAGGWKGFGDNAPIGQLRDQIMAHRFDELFAISGGPTANLSIRVNQRQIRQIETAILDAMNSFSDANMGITYRVIDIREIRLRDDVVDAILLRLKAGEEAQAIHQIEGERNNVRGDMVTSILNGISTGTGGKIGNRELELATVFAQISRRALTDDVLGLQYIQMLKAIASGEGMKIFNITPNPPIVDPEQIPDLSSLRQNGGS